MTDMTDMTDMTNPDRIMTADAFAVCLDDGTPYSVTVTLYGALLTVSLMRGGDVIRHAKRKVLEGVFSQGGLDTIARDTIRRQAKQDEKEITFLENNA